ncbi:hypothetical protein HOE425_332126 [Hoeflea sp. EC-HK425]|nr:hypothetical protein HOE425_332126 [Hoeflea sp. EC-HK425]
MASGVPPLAHVTAGHGRHCCNPINPWRLDETEFRDGCHAASLFEAAVHGPRHGAAPSRFVQGGVKALKCQISNLDWSRFHVPVDRAGGGLQGHCLPVWTCAYVRL